MFLFSMVGYNAGQFTALFLTLVCFQVSNGKNWKFLENQLKRGHKEIPYLQKELTFLSENVQGEDVRNSNYRKSFWDIEKLETWKVGFFTWWRLVWKRAILILRPVGRKVREVIRKLPNPSLAHQLKKERRTTFFTTLLPCSSIEFKIKLTHRFSWCIHCCKVLQAPSISPESFSLSLLGKHCHEFAASVQNPKFLQLCPQQEEYYGLLNHDGQICCLIRNSANDRKVVKKGKTQWDQYLVTILHT